VRKRKSTLKSDFTGKGRGLRNSNADDSQTCRRGTSEIGTLCRTDPIQEKGRHRHAASLSKIGGKDLEKPSLGSEGADMGNGKIESSFFEKYRNNPK